MTLVFIAIQIKIKIRAMVVVMVTGCPVTANLADKESTFGK